MYCMSSIETWQGLWIMNQTENMGHLSGLSDLKILRLTESISKWGTPQPLSKVFVYQKSLHWVLMLSITKNVRFVCEAQLNKICVFIQPYTSHLLFKLLLLQCLRNCFSTRRIWRWKCSPLLSSSWRRQRCNLFYTTLCTRWADSDARHVKK